MSYVGFAMNDGPAQSPTQNYADAYKPPGGDSPGNDVTASDPLAHGQQPTVTSQNASDNQVQQQADLHTQFADSVATTPPQNSQEAAPATYNANSTSESIEDQNIFFLLGVANGSDEQKEAFLDELQQVIWEDFLEYDVKLLVTSDELTQLQKLLDESEENLDQQEEVVKFLEKLIPDLEEIMLEKALELKEEMVRERAAGLKTFYADKPESIKRVEEAVKLMDEGKWYSAAHAMNSLTPPT